MSRARIRREVILRVAKEVLASGIRVYRGNRVLREIVRSLLEGLEPGSGTLVDERWDELYDALVKAIAEVRDQVLPPRRSRRPATGYRAPYVTPAMAYHAVLREVLGPRAVDVVFQVLEPFVVADAWGGGDGTGRLAFTHVHQGNVRDAARVLARLVESTPGEARNALCSRREELAQLLCTPTDHLPVEAVDECRRVVGEELAGACA